MISFLRLTAELCFCNLLQMKQAICAKLHFEELVVEQNELNVPDADATSIGLSARAKQLSLCCQGGCEEASLKVRLAKLLTSCRAISLLHFTSTEICKRDALQHLWTSIALAVDACSTSCVIIAGSASGLAVADVPHAPAL